METKNKEIPKFNWKKLTKEERSDYYYLRIAHKGCYRLKCNFCGTPSLNNMCDACLSRYNELDNKGRE